MPCNGGPYYGHSSPERWAQECKILRKRVDFLTRHLCALCKLAEQGEVPELRDDLLQWWMDHKREDQLREEQEELEKSRRQTAIDAYLKLTKEERRALGVRMPPAWIKTIEGAGQ